MNTLETLAFAALCSVLKLDEMTYEDVEEERRKIRHWPVCDMLYRAWLKKRLEKKRNEFRQVHRQLVSIYTIFCI